MYHYCAIFVQSMSAYTLTDRYKKCLVKDDRYKRSMSRIRDRVKDTRVTIS